ncbi:MAG: galactokinase [Clostridia bacterium]|nr:galactokinase [Clostridia bacterium]
MFKNIEKIFKETYQKDYKKFFSPGRVNLIGEHTDYNGGHVFPCTISLGTYGVANLNEGNYIRCYSMNFKEFGFIQVDLEDLSFQESHNWVNFVKGVILQFEKRGYKLHTGFDLVIEGNIPGGGLSSSSSLELLTSVMLKSLYNFDIDRLEMVKLSQAVENEYMGVNSGIMDQFIIGMGKEDHGILLDTNTLKYEYVPLILKDYVILIGNTNKKRTLADSKYNERYNECQSALKELKKHLDIKSLGDLSIEAFETHKVYIENEILKKRAKHAVYENQRTIQSLVALKNGDLTKFGELMYASHASLKEDYEVSCFELDVMVDLMSKSQGVIGSRMTGAGFGGCTVSIVEKNRVDEIIRSVYKDYLKIVGYSGDFHVVEIGPGALEIVK